jgi:hypothetical protein
MLSKIPKTGLAGRMRAWMSQRRGAFTPEGLCEGLFIPRGKARFPVFRAMQDFEARGEILRLSRNLRRNKFRYNRAWRMKCPKGQGPALKSKILKAMRLLSFREPFALTDIKRLAEVPGRNYIDKIARKLVVSGHLEKCGFRPCVHGAGREALYRVLDFDRFRIEVMS